MSRKAYRLGGLFEGRLYFYTAMGDHDSHASAAAHFAGEERVAYEQSVTIETVPVVRHGIEYGHTYRLRNMAGEDVAE